MSLYFQNATISIEVIPWLTYIVQFWTKIMKNSINIELLIIRYLTACGNAERKSTK